MEFFIAVASGPITGWKPNALSLPMATGQKIYMHVSLVGDYVRLRVLDRNNFNRVFCELSYYDNGYFPDNGSGVRFNRQITLCDSDKKLGTGIYFKEASFSDSYLYSTSGYSKYSSSNTDSSRRGKFVAEWNSPSNVTVHSSTSWYAEKISIQF